MIQFVNEATCYTGGIKLTFTDIKAIRDIMEDELEN